MQIWVNNKNTEEQQKDVHCTATQTMGHLIKKITPDVTRNYGN